MQPCSYYMQPCSYYMQQCSYCMQPCSYYMQPCSYYMQPCSYYMQPCSYYTQPCSYYMQPCSYYMQPCSYCTQIVRFYIALSQLFGYLFFEQNIQINRQKITVFSIMDFAKILAFSDFKNLLRLQRAYILQYAFCIM